jgi:hypothetical protein
MRSILPKSSRRHLLLTSACLAMIDARAVPSVCVPPAGFIDIPLPQIVLSEPYASHTEEVTI